MNKLNFYHLLIKCPPISGFVTECYRNGEIDKLLDFLHAIEFKDFETVH